MYAPRGGVGPQGLETGGPSKADLVARFRGDNEFDKKGAMRWKLLQRLVYDDFRRILQGRKITDADLRRCKVAWKANTRYRIAYEVLAAMLYHRDERQAAARLMSTSERLFRIR